MATSTAARPVRVGVFSTIAATERAVSNLLAAGFTKEEITVICSDEAKKRHFREYEHQEPAGTFAPAAAATGGVIGAALGGLTVLAFGAATGGIGLLAAGGIAAWSGGIVGGLVGAMLTRGVEKEAANFYNQAVQQGKLLVAVEDGDPDEQNRAARLATAAEILSAAGAEPLALPEG
jgi:hypothetical protein